MNTRLDPWPPLPPAVVLRRPRRRLPFPLEDPGCRMAAWARHGIWRGVQELCLGTGDAVLMPAYHHGSEVEAVLRADVDVRFYDSTPDLTPDRHGLERLVDDRVRAMYLTHVLGFPQDAARWRRWCDERGLLLIEDAAQAWLATHDGRPVGSHGDLAIFCLYKTVGLAEGAAVLQRPAGTGVALDPRFGLEPMLRRQARWLAGRSAMLWAIRRSALRRRGAGRPDAPPPHDGVGPDMELRDPSAGPWGHTPFLLRRLTDPEVAQARRRRYAVLLEALAPWVPQPFSVLPRGAAPFVFPVLARDKERVRAEARGVATLDLWARPHPALDVDRYPDARSRRATTIGLPVHQELRPRDVERIADLMGDLLD